MAIFQSYVTLPEGTASYRMAIACRHSQKRSGDRWAARIWLNFARCLLVRFWGPKNERSQELAQELKLSWLAGGSGSAQGLIPSSLRER